MEYIEALQSGSSPQIRKAAKAISKKFLDGYCCYLASALQDQIEKPRFWQTQCALIRAIGTTNCPEATKLLKNLIKRDYQATILYRELAFAIFSLENLNDTNLSFLFTSLKTKNELQIAGACSAVLYKNITPKENDIKRIINGISSYTNNEGQITSPRSYIAWIAYSWPKSDEVQRFLESCKTSNSSVLVEIATDALQGKKPKYTLI